MAGEAEEGKVEDTTKVDTPETEQVQPTAIEQKAQDQGWVPLDEWAGDPDDWRPAKEFMDRAPLYKKIDEQNRAIKELRRTMEDFSRHHNKLRETEYKRALADLKARKATALAEGDAEAVVEIDEALAEARVAHPNTQQAVVTQPAEENVIFQSWVRRNSWYEANAAMKAVADALGNKLGAQGMNPNEILTRVEQEVKKEFPHKFNNPMRDKPGAVEGGGSPKGSKGKDSFSLSDDERRAMQKFVKVIPGYTEEKYIAELKKLKGVS